MFDRRATIILLRLQLFAVFIFLSAAATAQKKSELRNLFTQAESHFLYGEYEMANPIYLTLGAFEPDNYNVLYKIGECYLNIPDEKGKAIEFLEKAVKNSDLEANPDQFKEKRAPIDAYFSLARAYMINNDLEKALSTLQVFQKMLAETKQKGGLENTEFIDQQIVACKNAMKLQETPVVFSKTRMPEEFCLGSVNEDPVVSFDGNTIAYTERRGISNAIFYSRKERGRWQNPVEITYEIEAGEDCSTSSLNSDGTELFLYKEDNADGNIYSSTYSDGTWSHIRKLNRNINTKFFESHAAISADGNSLYFCSNRDGGEGGLDIYVSEKDESGEWGEPRNLGATINTPFNEDTPFITANDSVLYFSSEGHASIGGFDIFKSQRLNDGWKTPQNLGFPISTTDDDRFFCPADNGKSAYYSMSTDYKKRDVYVLGIGVETVEQVYEITGMMSLADTVVPFDEGFKIILTDRTTGDTLDIGIPNKYTGNYNFEVEPGTFTLTYSGKGFLSQRIDTSVVFDNPALSINIDVVLERDTNYMAEPMVYEKIDLSEIPTVEAIDSAILITDVKVNDVTDSNIDDSAILYYTVQVMALHNPVDVSYFKYIDDMKVMYNDEDKFYRYTTGQFSTREEADTRRAELRTKGYPDDIFIKKVSR